MDDTWILKFNISVSLNDFSTDTIRSADYNEDEAGSFYEVIRIIGGTPLFYRSHFDRLTGSLDIAGYRMSGLTSDMLRTGISDLLRLNEVVDCNIKTVVFPARHIMYLYISPHHYPDEDERKNGVPVTLVRIVRRDPNIKRLDPDFKLKVAAAIKDADVFEALLVDDGGFITEGGRTNVFFIYGDEVRTAPAEMVLKGITREYVLKAIANAGIQLVEKAVRAEAVGKADAVFITGTSIKVLPVSEIDGLRFDPGNKTLQVISAAFDQVLEEEMENL